MCIVYIRWKYSRFSVFRLTVFNILVIYRTIYPLYQAQPTIISYEGNSGNFQLLWNRWSNKIMYNKSVKAIERYTYKRQFSYWVHSCTCFFFYLHFDIDSRTPKLYISIQWLVSYRSARTWVIYWLIPICLISVRCYCTPLILQIIFFFFLRAEASVGKNVLYDFHLFVTIQPYHFFFSFLHNEPSSALNNAIVVAFTCCILNS